MRFPRVTRESSHARFLALLILIHAVPAFAQGTARSLDIQPGARQNGLGAAGVALVGDPADALWWNPAALGFANQTGIQYTHSNLLPGLADLPHHHVAAATPLGKVGGFGASFTHLNYGSFSSYETSSAIALGIRVHPIVSLGATLKWVDVALNGINANGSTSDIGALVQLPQGPWLLGLGAVYQNLGGRFHFDGFDQSYPPSRNYKVGVSAMRAFEPSELVKARCTAVVDYNQSAITDEFHTWNGGIEGQLTYDQVMRGAVRIGYYNDPLGEIQDFTFGLGARAWLLSVDASWIPQAKNSDLDRVMKVTVGVNMDFSGERPTSEIP
jgi:hypothetical protein